MKLFSLLLLVVFTGCGLKKIETIAGRPFASDAVMGELRETRPAFNALSHDEQSVVYTWLLANCAEGAGSRRRELMKFSGPAELVLIEAFRMGPPVALLTELASRRRSDYAAIQESLAGEDKELFGSKIREGVASVSEDRYVQEGTERTITDYRIASLAGLAQGGSQLSVGWLERTMPALTNPELKRAAEQAVVALRARKR